MRDIAALNLRSIDLNLLTVFDAIFMDRNLTRAADRLGLSQPAMSNALARLRQSLGDPLFERTPHGMTPTPRARALSKPVRQALDLLQAGLGPQAGFDYASSEREFVLAMEDYGETVMLPRFAAWLARTAPGVQVRIRPEKDAALREELKQGRIDFAVDYFPILAEEIEARHLVDDTLVSMVRRDHPTVGDTLSIEQYISLPHVILGYRSLTGSLVDRELKRHGHTRKIALQVPHFVTMPQIVRDTDLICTLPSRMAERYADQLRLRILPTPIRFPSLSIYMMWGRAMSNDPGHQWLRNAFCDLISGSGLADGHCT